MAKKQKIENVGLELKMHFIRKFGSQDGAAKHFGMSKTMISRVVNGSRNPPASMLEDAGFTYEAGYFKS